MEFERRLGLPVNHDDFAHLKIPLESIVSATKNFSDGAESDAGNHYGGQFLWSGELIDIFVQRKSVIANDSYRYLAPVTITHYRDKKLHELIDLNLSKQMDSQSFDIFTETAYDCLNEERSQHSNIDDIVARLEKAGRDSKELVLPSDSEMVKMVVGCLNLMLKWMILVLF
nr:protein kinase-like domain, phloem protein 2-like protein [Tanacetum cinerariifolium]